MPDGLARAEVDPDPGIVLPGKIRHQPDGIAVVNLAEMLCPTSEDGPMDGGPEGPGTALGKRKEHGIGGMGPGCRIVGGLMSQRRGAPPVQTPLDSCRREAERYVEAGRRCSAALSGPALALGAAPLRNLLS